LSNGILLPVNNPDRKSQAKGKKLGINNALNGQYWRN
jgi:hypothetical protein